MTLTIDLSPMEQARLTIAAKQTGLEPAALAKKLVSEHLPPYPSDTDIIPPAPQANVREQDRIAMIRAAQGSLAYIAVTVNDLHRERQSDKQKEPSASGDTL